MTLYNAVASNTRKTWLIMFFFVVFVATIAYVYAQTQGYGLSFAGVALVFAGISSIGSYYFSDKLVLATTGAKPLAKEDNLELYRIVENLSIASGTPMPKLYLLHDPAPNAFATGRDPKHAVVAVTTGLLERLTKPELEGVIAHELSHIKNYDTRLMSIVAILVGFVAIMADMFMRSMWFGSGRRKGSQGVFLLIGLAFALLTPLVATLIQLAVSRKREFLADASGALLTRYPEGLASALEKIAQDPRPVQKASNATAHLFIENPFKEKNAGALFASLFNTHPPVAERVKILRSM